MATQDLSLEMMRAEEGPSAAGDDLKWLHWLLQQHWPYLKTSMEKLIKKAPFWISWISFEQRYRCRNKILSHQPNRCSCFFSRQELEPIIQEALPKPLNKISFEAKFDFDGEGMFKDGQRCQSHGTRTFSCCFSSGSSFSTGFLGDVQLESSQLSDDCSLWYARSGKLKLEWEEVLQRNIFQSSWSELSGTSLKTRLLYNELLQSTI